jgi:hypothetical protein
LKLKTISIFVESVTRKTPNSLKMHHRGIMGKGFTAYAQGRVHMIEKRVNKPLRASYFKKLRVG